MEMRPPAVVAVCALLAGAAVAGATRTPRTNPQTNVVVVGDIGRLEDMPRIRARVALVCGPDAPAASRPDAIEIATDVDIGPGMDCFAPFDAMVRLAREHRVRLYFRLKPHVRGAFPKAVLRETRPNEKVQFVTSKQESFCSRAYVEAVTAYYRAIARRYAAEETVAGFGIGVGLSGETQYPTEGTRLGDFSDVAFAEYASWMRDECGLDVRGWPRVPPLVAPDTRVATGREYYLWALWRSRRLAGVIGEIARALRAAAPRKALHVFSYLGLNSAPGYSGGLIEELPDIDCYLGNISADHGFYARRDQDRSRTVALGGSPKSIGCELDLISAYTDPNHMEAYVRYFCLMGGQPRPFLPVWYTPATKGGWAEKFWTPYSDDLALRMCRVVNENLHLQRTASVADVAVVLPEISGAGIMATWGPWMSHEYKLGHADVVRHLAAIGSNFELVSEANITARRLRRYRLVVVISPALYPWVREALSRAAAHVLALGWAGTVVAPAPGDLATGSTFDGRTRAWWPSAARVARRDPVVRATDHPLWGDLAGTTLRYPEGAGRLPYLRGMTGEPLARDDEGEPVAAITRWGARRLYHFGMPLGIRGRGALLDDGAFQRLLARILRACSCTAYQDLGPLRLFETSRYLLVENPNGTRGTVQKPEGEFRGAFATDQLRNKPARSACDERGRLELAIPAGGSVIIPLGDAARLGQ